MLSNRRIGGFCVTCLLFALIPLKANAALSENEVLILYNSQSAVSTTIKNAYVAAHPSVHVFDLNFGYTTPIDPNNPAPTDVTRFYIHPTRFLQLFGSGSALDSYLTNNPEILSIVTTREIPSVITDDFLISNPIDSDGRRSLESVIANLPYIGANPLLPSTGVANPYLASGTSFSTFLAANPTSDLRYLVCRLDSANAGAWTSPPSDSEYVDDVLDLISRSASLKVNKFEVTSFVDDWDVLPGTSFNVGFLDRLRPRHGLFELWQNRWCVKYEGTCEFIHGPDDPLYCVTTDSSFSGDYLSLAILTAGRHHNNSGPSVGSPCTSCTATTSCDPCVSSHGSGAYVRYFNPHAAGYFQSLESFNGLSLHNPSTTTNHGQCLDWIAKGGSFTIAHIAEPMSNKVELFGPITTALYIDGMSWAEAAYQGVLNIRWMNTPIGDPLAIITVLDPDVDMNGMIDKFDFDIVELSMMEETITGDINGDGVSDQDDLDLVLDVIGRSCAELSDLACRHCVGDTNNDCVVNGIDLANVIAATGTFSGTADQNCDGIVDGADLAIVLANFGHIRGDLDNNGMVTPADGLLFPPIGTTYLDPGYNPRADLNCDKVISGRDSNILNNWNFVMPCPYERILP